jgi:SAM-dependent methyltransferase
MNFKGLVRCVIGIDPDRSVATNPYCTAVVVAKGEHIPFRDNSFDVAYACNVVEHLEHPLEVFKEVYRVLKPGGSFFVKTPNKWHYVSMLARLTPHRFHTWYNELRGRGSEDTYPTRYKGNSRLALKRLAAQSGFLLAGVEQVEGRPEYLRLCTPTYLLGWLYERVVNSSRIFAGLRVLLIAEFHKPRERVAESRVV